MTNKNCFFFVYGINFNVKMSQWVDGLLMRKHENKNINTTQNTESATLKNISTI